MGPRPKREDGRRLDRLEQSPGVASPTECAIHDYIAWLRAQDVECFLEKHGHMGTGWRFACGENLSQGFRIALEFLVTLLEAARVFPGISGTALTDRIAAHNSEYFLFEPRALSAG